MIIGICGTLGAGKGTAVTHLESKGFVHYSISGRLAEMLKDRALSGERKNLSELADELAESYPGGILEVMHRQAKTDGVEHYILESIHRESEASYIQSVGGKILAVDADPKVRFERTAVRQEGEKDNVSFEEFLESIEREEQGKGNGTPNINEVVRKADHIIMNDGTIEDLHTKVEQWLQTLT